MKPPFGELNSPLGVYGDPADAGSRYTLRERGDVIISGRTFREPRRKERVLLVYPGRKWRHVQFLMDEEKVEMR